MTGDHDERNAPEEAAETTRSRLQLVRGATPSEPSCESEPTVRLRREFKGLTVADVTRDEIARRLPGQIRSAIAHLDNGNLAAAEAAVPSTAGTVLEGPGHRRRRRWSWLWLLTGISLLAGSALANWLIS